MQDGISFRGVHIPEQQLRWQFTTSGGPGGQHANRSNTAVELRLNVRDCDALPERLRQRVLRRLGDRITGAGDLIVTAGDHRSQTRNRADALRRMRDLLTEATSPPAKPRRPTRPSRRARERRLADKRHRGEIKRHRQAPDW